MGELFVYEVMDRLTGTGDIQRVQAGVGVTEYRSCAGGESFDLGCTLPHVLVRLKQDDVDFRDEHTRESYRRTDVDAYTQCSELYLKINQSINQNGFN